MDAPTTPIATGSKAAVVETLLQVGIHSASPQAWANFAPAIGGRAEISHGTTTISLAEGKSIVVTDGPPASLAFARWAVPDLAPISAAPTNQFRSGAAGAPNGRSPSPGDTSPVVQLADPDGIEIQLAIGPEPADTDTGLPARLGHVVVGVASLDRSLAFYTETLGLQISDRVRIPLPDGGETTGVFLHAADRRHHSIALIGTRPGLRHIMVELADLDAVGIAYDHFSAVGAVRRTLGRHTNDRMVSFYAEGPDGLEIEIGCGGELVDEESWEIVTHDRPSLWGHHFVHSTRGSDA